MTTKPDVSGWVRVENSAEAALGGGVLAAIVERSGSSFVHEVRCDPTQTGDEVEFIAIGGNTMVGPVYLRVRVDEVVPATAVMPCWMLGKAASGAQINIFDGFDCTQCGEPVEKAEDGWRHVSDSDEG